MGLFLIFMKVSSADLNKALKKSPKALGQWSSLTPLAKRDFVTWVEGAKQEETKLRRISKACDILAKGKRRPCCYSTIPLELYKLLFKNPKANKNWKALDSIKKRDLSDWINEGKEAKDRRKRAEEVLRKL